MLKHDAYMFPNTNIIFIYKIFNIVFQIKNILIIHFLSRLWFVNLTSEA